MLACGVNQPSDPGANNARSASSEIGESSELNEFFLGGNRLRSLQNAVCKVWVSPVNGDSCDTGRDGFAEDAFPDFSCVLGREGTKNVLKGIRGKFGEEGINALLDGRNVRVVGASDPFVHVHGGTVPTASTDGRRCSRFVQEILCERVKQFADKGIENLKSGLWLIGPRKGCALNETC